MLKESVLDIGEEQKIWHCHRKLMYREDDSFREDERRGRRMH